MRIRHIAILTSAVAVLFGWLLRERAQSYQSFIYRLRNLDNKLRMLQEREAQLLSSEMRLETCIKEHPVEGARCRYCYRPWPKRRSGSGWLSTREVLSVKRAEIHQTRKDRQSLTNERSRLVAEFTPWYRLTWP